MNRTDVINLASARAGLTKKDTEKAVIAAFEIMSKALLNGETVKISGFGTFEVRERSGRTARNPRTNVTVKVAPSRAVRFRPGKILGVLSASGGESEE